MTEASVLVSLLLATALSGEKCCMMTLIKAAKEPLLVDCKAYRVQY